MKATLLARFYLAVRSSVREARLRDMSVIQEKGIDSASCRWSHYLWVELLPHQADNRALTCASNTFHCHFLPSFLIVQHSTVVPKHCQLRFNDWLDSSSKARNTPLD